MRKILLVCLGLVLVICSANAQSDSVKVFGYDAFVQRVRAHHPLAKKADLQKDKGQEKVKIAKGGFDPSVSVSVQQKYFDDKQYYSLIDNTFKVPTWFGLDVAGGYEANRGVLLNPENTSPDAGLIYFGVTLPLGQGLFMDQRRSDLMQAKIYQEGTEQEALFILNEVLFKSSYAYWDWCKAYNERLIYANALTVARKRLNAVKRTIELGDRPAIDSIEASIQTQNRLLNYQQADLNYKNATAQLEVFLWDEGSVPLELAENTIPGELASQNNASLNLSPTMIEDSLYQNHPALRTYDYKLAQLEIERKWKAEQLKPTLNLKYNPITESFGGEVDPYLSLNNYMWGLEFKMPLFLRKERGNVNMTKLQILETELERDNQAAKVMFAVKEAQNEWQTSIQQVSLYQQTVQYSQQLLDGERALFNQGESSLFMINAREWSYFKARVKLVELMTKNKIAEAKVLYAFGLLPTAP